MHCDRVVRRPHGLAPNADNVSTGSHTQARQAFDHSQQLALDLTFRVRWSQESVERVFSVWPTSV
jgi:hypothetical protein